MENIEAALSDRQSGAMAQTMLLDNLHVTREKAEKLEARLRRQTAEEEVREFKDPDGNNSVYYHFFKANLSQLGNLG